jgi:RraA family protein
MQQPGFRILPRVETAPEIVALFAGLPSSIISDNMNRITGTWGLQPMHRPGTQMLGQAITVRVRSGDNLMIHKALELGRPGDVLVVDGDGSLDRGLMGEIMKRVAQSRQFAGVVIDGAIRDVASYRGDSFPCYARGVCHRGPYKEGPGEINVAVAISGVVVRPGDIVVGDDDGVVFIQPSDAVELAAASRRKLAAEEKTFREIASGTYDETWIDASLRARGVLAA